MKRAIFLFLLPTLLSARISPEVREQIQAKHWHTSHSGGARFRTEMTPKRLEKLARQAIGSGHKTEWKEGLFAYDYRFTFPLGRDRNGEVTDRLRVIADAQGHILDAFPN